MRFPKSLFRLATLCAALTFAMPSVEQNLPDGDDDTAEGDERRESEAEKKARIEKELRDKKRIEQEERERIEAEVRARLAAEEQEKARAALEAENAKKLESKMRQEAEDRIRREAALKAEAEAKLRAEQAPVKSDAEIRAEVQAKIRAEEEARLGAKERARAKIAAQEADAQKERELMEAQLKKEERELELRQVKGRSIVAGAGVNHSYTLTFNGVTNEQGVDENVASSTLFLSAAPRLGFFVGPENLEVNGFGGVLVKQVTVSDDGGTAIETDGFVGAGVNYHLPMSARLFFVFGADLAGYWGGGERPVSVVLDEDNPEIKQIFQAKSSTFGVMGTVRAGPGYMINPVFQVRASLEGNALLGLESFQPPPTPQNLNPPSKSFGQSLFNTGIRISVFAFF